MESESMPEIIGGLIGVILSLCVMVWLLYEALARADIQFFIAFCLYGIGIELSYIRREIKAH